MIMVSLCWPRRQDNRCAQARTRDAANRRPNLTTAAAVKVVMKDEAVRSSTFTFASTDGVSLFVYRWSPDVAPKAGVQIAHGLVEHAGRYARLAKALIHAGYAVYAGDHRGHGRTASTPEDFGFFAERDGWRKS